MKISNKVLQYGAVVFVAVVILIIYNANSNITDELESPLLDQPRISLEQNELDLLARAVYAESRGEPYEGQIAVAAVILNRVEHPEFPNTIAGVIYEPLAFQVVANGQINQTPDQEAEQAAFEALHGLDPTRGAIYFYNPSKTQNQWIRSREVMKTIGKHIFAS